MRALYSKHFQYRPTAQVVALFSGLNLIMIFLFSLVVNVGGPESGAPAISSIWQILIRLVFTIAIYVCILYFLRDSQRTKNEFIAMIVLAVGVMLLLSWFALPFVAFGVLPIVARNWLSLRQTLWVVFHIFNWTVVWMIIRFYRFGGLPNRFEDETSLLMIIIMATITSLIFAAYVMLCFEFASREARAREEMGVVYTELEQSYSLLNSYHDLEIKHAHLAERTRISRELHDTLGHHLTAQHFDLNVAIKLNQDKKSKENISRALQRNQDAIEDVRRAVHALQEDKFEQLNLTEAIQELVTLSQERKIDFQVQGIEKQLSAPLTLTLYRLVQESLTNHLKHSPDTPLALLLSYKNNNVEFQAQNPFLQTQVVKQPLIEGFGLTGLKERVEELGGEWQAGLSEKEFQIWARLPI